MQFVNTKLLSHPLNWATVILMLVIAGTAGHLLLTLAGVEPAKKEANNLPAGQSAIA